MNMVMINNIGQVGKLLSVVLTYLQNRKKLVSLK